MEMNSTILVTGASGMVGRATVNLLRERGCANILAPCRTELDLLSRDSVFSYFRNHRPDYVLMIAAKVGGIAANAADPVGFLDENMRIVLNLYSACDQYPTKKNLFLGSSCIYPRNSPQPIREEFLLTGPLEPTNEGYALAKIVGLKMASYLNQQRGLKTVCLMPCNIYGTGDHFEFDRSHVLSALVRRFVDARDSGAASVTLWGTGIARREFIHVDDVARAILFFLEAVETSEHINLGTGVDIAITDLAEMISMKTGFQGQIQWDASKPDGMLRKCLDVTRMYELGFVPTVSLDEGTARLISEYETLKASCGNIK